MESSYKLYANDLNISFLNSIKAAYGDKKIEIRVQEVYDETDYLLSSPANKAHLLKSIAQLNKKEKLIAYNVE